MTNSPAIQPCSHIHIDYIYPAICRDCDTYLDNMSEALIKRQNRMTDILDQLFDQLAHLTKEEQEQAIQSINDLLDEYNPHAKQS